MALTDGFPDKWIAELVNLYKSAYLDILKMQKNITPVQVSRNRTILREIEGVLQGLDKETVKWLQAKLPVIYKDGLQTAENQLKENGFKLTATSFTQIHKDAIEIIAKDSYLDFAKAMDIVRKESRRSVDEALKLQIRIDLAKGAIEGQTLKQNTETLVKNLKAKGVEALTDKAGKRWQLDNYAEMLTRTKAVQAHNAGVSNRMIENGYDLVEVSSHPDSSAVCYPYQGKVYSLTGATKGYKLLDEAIGGGLFHPNCRHTITPYHSQLADI